MTTAVPPCLRCLRELPADARYCPTCGTRVFGMPRMLRRRRADQQLAGVCAGMADYFDLDPTLVRVLYLVGSFFTGILPGVVLYGILAFVVPAD